ncbi:death-on-curing protein [Pueribacillus theae]|uniref:Death-on-curing protein n=1 Tax=Pueribacillus theae TaxID=2171751 RepID=A0A2U1K1A3_9BACI|nr:Fic family protein [Pueribacillus theae]PWA11192.1 death-on-curing protein [Pueribacillus theae]
MEKKFHLTKEQNVFLAKKTIVENIYHTAKLENVNITFPETQTILNGVSVGGLSMDDVQVILNLRDAWRYTLDNIDKPFSLEFACKVNENVARNESLNWGVLRDGNVGIHGVSHVPEVPEREKVEKKIKEIMEIENDVDRALSYYVWAMRSQLFWDGNKRTSNICANKLLIESGSGIVTVKEENLKEFHVLLSKFYETNDSKQLKQFLYDKCLYGMTFQKENNMKK